MATLLCVPITVHDADAALADARAAREAGADLVEYRLDELFEGELEAPAGGPHPALLAIDRLLAASPLPCIATCRLASEGGAYSGSDDARAALYERLAAAGPGRAPAYLDVELAAFAKSPALRRRLEAITGREGSPALILSTHDFTGRPADLSRRILAMQGDPAAAVAKLAFKARSLRDNLEVFEALSHREKPMIALAMGEFGLPSRVLAPRFGAFLTFAALRPAAVTAPGQPTVRDLLDLYRFRAIGPATAVYGVAGWPVGHSLSPLVHNAAFAASGHDGVYLPLPIPTPEEPHGDEDAYLLFKATLLDLVHDERLNLRGASITLPHKEHLLRLALAQGWGIDPAARAIGAANTLTLRRSPGGSLEAAAVLNTDAPGLTDALKRTLPSLANVPVAVIGAGGAARAAAYALANEHAVVTLHNRDEARARDLAADLAPRVHRGPDSASLEALATSEAAVFIHCTPQGMKGGPAPDACPLPEEAFRARGNRAEPPIVFDTVYNPIETPLLRRARAAGWRVIDGVSMFVRQAALQSHAWTGRWPDESQFDRLVRERLA